MATYLVTGACGFIGSNYIQWLCANEPDANIVALDNLGFASNEANLAPVRDQISFEHADIGDHERMLGIYETHSPDFVVNLAAESHHDRAIVSPTESMRVNALGAQNMLECSRLRPVTRHLHVSTIGVYGELANGAEYFNEASPLNAKSPYSAAKAAGDQIVRSYMQTYPDMDVAMTHCTNNYGPYQLPEKFIPLIITNVLRGRRVPVHGDGMQQRDWLHVLDHCRAIHTVLHAELPPVTPEAATNPGLLPIFDISARREVTNLEIVNRILAALEQDPADWVDFVGNRPNHDHRYPINPTKIETVLGWAPTLDFDCALADTARWYVDNQDWWSAIFEQKGELQHDWTGPK